VVLQKQMMKFVRLNQILLRKDIYIYNNTSEKDEEKPKGNIPPLSFKRKRPKDDTRTKSDDFKRKAFNEEIDKSVETSSEEIK